MRNYERRDLILFAARAMGITGIVLRRLVRANMRALAKRSEIVNKIMNEAEGQAKEDNEIDDCLLDDLNGKEDGILSEVQS
jgi:hypothetical protein